MSTAVAGASFDIPGYRLVRQIGQGGMATVYLAIQVSLGRPVAVKVLAAEHTPNDEAATRFEQEARTIARLDHPHIVNIYDVGRTSTGQLYYTMPYLPNGDLGRRKLGEQPARIVEIMRALLKALAYAHEQGIVHRDVKPENVLFDKLDRPLLADFGIALATHNHLRVTRTGTTLGSSGYMSPEQARGQATDGRSDLYSLGVVCYELLTGELPFHGPDALSVAIAHLENPIPRLPPMKRLWQALLDRAMSKTPAERFQNADEMLEAVEELAVRLDNGESGGLGAWIDAHRPHPGRGALVGLAALAGAGLLLVALAKVVHAPRASADPVAAAPLPADAAPAPAATAAPAGPMLSADAMDGLLREGNAMLGKGKLVSPIGANAAERFLAVLRTYPDNAEAQAGLQGVVDALGTRIVQRVQDGEGTDARDLYEQAQRLADQGRLRGKPAWRAFETRVGDAASSAVDDATRALDRDRLDALAPLATALRRKADAPSQAGSLAELIARVPKPGAVFEDAGGPALVFVPAAWDGERVEHAYAIGRSEVTRGQYAAFVHASGRATSSCVEPMNPFSRLRRFAWDDPGFAQTNDHPVVCVSWRDALAYTRWLSQRTGQRYRLPTEREWLHVARGVGGGSPCALGDVADASREGRRGGTPFACGDGFPHTAPAAHFAASDLGVYDLLGNASEWTADCARGSALRRMFDDDTNCVGRWYRGLSWRDGDGEGNLQHRGDAAPEIGYTTVGFRVLREVDAEHLPPPTAP